MKGAAVVHGERERNLVYSGGICEGWMVLMEVAGGGSLRVEASGIERGR